MNRPTLIRQHWPLLVLLTLTLLFFHRLAFSGLILARGDTFNYFYPYWAARNAALMQGQWPLWSPDIFMGVPLLANPQLGTFYPPNWLVASLSPPAGIRISILLHVFWALLGAYWLARRTLSQPIPALTAAAIFGLGGYVGAHVEQINQLQGLAWLPWLLLLYERATERPRRYVPLLGMALALQFLSGHTQTLFVSAVGLGLYAIIHMIVRAQHAPQVLPPVVVPLRKRLTQHFLTLIIAGLLALPLIVPQLMPTLELTGVSNRSGGLTFNEATSFSFNPLVIGRGLLPGYDGVLFGEFVAYVGVIGLGLAFIGALIPRDSALSRQRHVWLALALLGLLLALGEFNPVYQLLLRLPGFSLFRVPARWLALFALGAAMLAGIGLQMLLDSDYRPRWWHLALILLVTGGLAISTLFTPTEAVIGPATPTVITWVGWGLALAGFIVMYRMRSLVRAHGGAPLLLVLLILELFLASGVLPYNRLLPPETYSGQRFTISQLLAYQPAQTPPGRLLSISGLLFDPGDKVTLENRYAPFGLSDLAVRIGLVATKRKEIVAPNLPLVWAIPSIDGFDGGLLPTRFYTAFSSLLLPPNADPSVDGRLFEALAREDCRGACIPDQRWLNLTNTRYLVTDKVFDLWHEGVAFDTQFSLLLNPGETISLANPTGFEANALDLLYDSSSVPDVTFALAQSSVTLRPESNFITIDRLGRKRLTTDLASQPAQVNITPRTTTRLYAVSLVDRRTGDFAQLTLGPWQRRLSSDIKLYENQNVLPRALVVHETQFVADSDTGTDTALDLMRDPAFDPVQVAVIHISGANSSAIMEYENSVGQLYFGRSNASPLQDTFAQDVLHRESTTVGAIRRVARHDITPVYFRNPHYGTEESKHRVVESEVKIENYAANRIEMTVETESDGYLILTDAWYPGWRATVNGVDVPVQRANIMFRAVPLASGSSEVIFTYNPSWLPGALIIGLIAWGLTLAGAVILNYDLGRKSGR